MVYRGFRLPLVILLTLAIAIVITISRSAVAHHSNSPCLASFDATSDPPTSTVEVYVQSIRLNSDMEGDDNAIPFYDNKADVYGRVTINGVVHDLPKINDDNHPHWDEQPPGPDAPRGGVFREVVPATPDPTGKSLLPVPISIEIRESDGGLTGDDDVVDVSPRSDDAILDLEFDLCRLNLSGDHAVNGMNS
jgi:hypothetical protein